MVVSAIGEVEDVHAKLAGDLLVDLHRLEEAHIELVDCVSTKSIATYTGIGITTGYSFVLVIEEPVNGTWADRFTGAEVKITNSRTGVPADGGRRSCRVGEDRTAAIVGDDVCVVVVVAEAI